MPTISFRCSGDFQAFIDELLEESSFTNRTDLIKYILSESATSTIGVDSEVLKEYEEVVRIDRKDRIDKRIAQERKKTATLHTFMAKVCWNMKQQGATTEEVLQVLEPNMRVAQRRDVLDKLELLQEWIENSKWENVQEWCSKYERDDRASGRRF